MKESNGTVLIVARPGELRDGLSALLAATGKVGRITQADDGQAALALIGQSCPLVAVLDWDPTGGDLPTLLKRIKAECPGTKCLVLADGVEQQREAEFAGADKVDTRDTDFFGRKATGTVDSILVRV